VNTFFNRLSYLDQPMNGTKASFALQFRVFCKAHKLFHETALPFRSV